MRLLTKVCLLAWLSSLGLALDIHGQIAWNSICPGAADLGPAKVILDAGYYSGSVSASGNWTIYDVPQGVYSLSVVSHDHTFDQLRIDVPRSTKDTAVPEVRPHPLGTALSPPSNIQLPYPIKLAPRVSWKKPLAGVSGSAPAYYVPPESFNLMGMFQNPMMIMMVFAGGMMLAMPYLMKNMDPEALEELKTRQAKMASVQSAMSTGDFKGGLSALLAGDEEPAKPSPSGGQKSTSRGLPKGRGRRR